MRVGSNVPATFGVLDERDDILTPDALLQQVGALVAGGFEHVELPGDFMSYDPEIYSASTVESLNQMRSEHGVTFSIHAQNSLCVAIDSLEERVRQASVEAVLTLYEALAPLGIQCVVFHSMWAQRTTLQVDQSALPDKAKFAVMSRVAEQTARSLRELCRHIDSRAICQENLGIDFDWVNRLVEEFDTSICFDGGHWCILGNDLLDFVRRYGSGVASVHCHDVKNGIDHQPLEEDLTLPWFEALQALRAKQFDGPVVLEVKSVANSLASHATLQRIVKSIDLDTPAGTDRTD